MTACDGFGKGSSGGRYLSVQHETLPASSFLLRSA